ncbi:MAG: hypothetical protein BAA01_01000 [Bacillus thermozeamaize]|uniref:Cell wall-active antibiotics response LiaF-like C-terminal domain-containing protein n=1 Tax=Bacillus thermozeamaize TaxID=230954 RepID=A0A1Y3PE20_9BACI|nr:MAG: hypothetical protein BAA01_01000 [Bacillus thermozeamaize]
MGGRWLAGIILLVIGVTLLLDNLGFAEISLGWIFSHFWPVILIVVGVSMMVSQKGGGMLAGGIIALLGVLFLARNLGWWTIDLSWLWKVFWPLVIILIGIRILFGASQRGNSRWAIMGSIQKTFENGPWKLESGGYTAIMGGIELDLRQAIIPEGETVIDVTTLMGGAEIRVPRDLPVICEGSVIMGGMELLGRSNGGIFANLEASQGELHEAPRRVRFRCQSIMGGIEIKAV